MTSDQPPSYHGVPSADSELGVASITLVFLMLLTVSWAHATNPSVAAKKRELRDVQRQLEEKKDEIARYQRETEILKQDVSQLAGEKSLWKARIRGFERLISGAEQKRAELKSRIVALESAEDRWQGVLSRDLNGYVEQTLLESEYIGTADLWEQSVRRTAILEKVSFIRDLGGSKLNAEKAAQEANLRAVNLQSKSAEAVAERQESDGLLRAKQAAFLASQQRMERTQKDVDDLRDSAVALTQLVRALEQKHFGRGRQTPAVVVFAEHPHSLPWPAQGRVVAEFGRQFIPELKTWVIHQGIRLSTSQDAAVHPVQAGKVIFSGPFRSYGNVIIVDHGKSFYTIYGKLGKTMKKPGDRVVIADTIGTAQNDGKSGTLYFEMRQSADALDPLAWLRRRDR